MPKIHNNTDRDITAVTKHCFPAQRALEVSETTYTRLANEPSIDKLLRRGDLVVTADEPAPAEPEITREFIAKAKRSELLNIILSHYPDDVTEADFEGVTVDDRDGEDGLRTIAARIVFSDL